MLAFEKDNIITFLLKMSAKISEYTIIGMAINNDLDMFVSLFNDKIKQDRNFKFDFNTVICVNIDLNRYEFVKVINKLNLSNEFKQELYYKGFLNSVLKDNLSYMKEYINLLTYFKIEDYVIEAAIARNCNRVIKYLVKYYYFDYNNIMMIAADYDNYKIINWLLTDFNFTIFDINTLIKKTQYSYNVMRKVRESKDLNVKSM